MATFRWQRLLFTALAPAALASCTASLELDRFRETEARSVDGVISVSYYDVKFAARSMTSHLTEFLEVRIVDKDNRTQAKAVYEDVSGPDFTLYLRRIVPKANAPYRIDWWADHNNTSRYDGIVGGINEKDHAWRRVLADPLPEDMRLVEGRYELDFLHDTAFVDVSTDLLGNKIELEDSLLPFSFQVEGAGGFLGKTVEIRVTETASGRLVGFHRRGRAKDSYPVNITGILDEETAYEVSTYVDVNGNGRYDADDPSWKQALTSDGNGIVSGLNMASVPTSPIETGEP